MLRLFILILMIPFTTFTVACGSDSDDGGDTDTSSGSGTDVDVDAGDTQPADGGVGPAVDSGTGEVTALTACTDFQHASWDRIRACGSPTADILPTNELAESICGMLCEVEGKVVSKSEYDTCVTYGRTVPCEDIDVDLDAGSQIPDECAFLKEMSCLF